MKQAWECPRATVLLSSGTARLPFKEMMMPRTGFNDYYVAALSWVDVCFAV
jgi:hypothetical protein